MRVQSAVVQTESLLLLIGLSRGLQAAYRRPQSLDLL